MHPAPAAALEVAQAHAVGGLPAEISATPLTDENQISLRKALILTPQASGVGDQDRPMETAVGARLIGYEGVAAYVLGDLPGAARLLLATDVAAIAVGLDNNPMRPVLAGFGAPVEIRVTWDRWAGVDDVTDVIIAQAVNAAVRMTDPAEGVRLVTITVFALGVFPTGEIVLDGLLLAERIRA